MIYVHVLNRGGRDVRNLGVDVRLDYVQGGSMAGVEGHGIT
jgi:hypothetical protein